MRHDLNGRKMKRLYVFLFCAALILTLALAINASILGTSDQDTGPKLVVDKTATAYNITCGQEILVTLNVTVEGFGGPVDVMLVIDRSGSMLGNPLDAAKAAAISFIDNRTFTGDPATSDWVGISSYATTVSLDQGLTDNSTLAKSAIDGLSAGLSSRGYTNIMAGVHVAQEELATNGRNRAMDIIIVLSDGVANRWTDFTTGTTYKTATWPTTNTTSILKAIDEATAAKNAGTIVFTIGLNLAALGPSQGVARDTLKQMATSLNYFFDAATPGYLEAIYAIIATYIGPGPTIMTLTDVVEDEFTIVAGSINPSATAIIDNTIIWNFSVAGSETKIFQYKIRPIEGLEGLYPTNVEANLTYIIDPEGSPATLWFPIPFVELHTYTPAPQRLWTTNSSGFEEIDEFLIGTAVYLKTSDMDSPLVPGKYCIWLFEGNLIPENGDVIPDDFGTPLGETPLNVTTTSEGRFDVVKIWDIPDDPTLICHNYTVILDQLELGLYPDNTTAPNQGVWGDEDYRDDLCTRKPTPPSFHVIPEVALGTIMVLVSMFGSLGYYVVRKKKIRNLK